MKRVHRLISLLCCLILLLSSVLAVLPVTASATTDDDTYAQSLRTKGFPEGYINRLVALHKKYPNWEFEPILVTSYDSRFTFDYVTEQENRKSGSGSYYNLVSTSTWAPQPYTSLGNGNYSPYYDTSNTTLYDSGWRKASLSAIRYFMDPRNFLNEYDIFMFESLAYNSDIHTESRVSTALAGTFMGNNAQCDNGMTYAAYLTQVGAQQGISPVFLASRLKQEQGAGGSPMVTGTLGTTLVDLYVNKPTTYNGNPVWGSISSTQTFDTAELLSYDGYYNFFNIGASGTGYFAIFYNAAKEAKEGAWTTKAAAISGGAVKIATKYVGDYQDTLYTQKFNIDPRSSRTLWGQYMQNISAPLTEGRNSRSSYSSEGILSSAFVFRIPVYSGMPDTACADPANGVSYLSPSVDTSAYDDATVETGEVTRYRVQCGAFSVKANADNQSAKLTSAGIAHQVLYEEGEYRLIANVYDTQAEAEARVAQIQAAGYAAMVTTVQETVTVKKLILQDGSSYTVRSGILYLPAKTTLQAVKNAFIGSVKITAAKTNSSLAGTGTTVTNGVSTLTVVVRGDVNGNGIFDSNDALLIRACLLNNSFKPKSETALIAADINNNGRIDSHDFVMARINFFTS